MNKFYVRKDGNPFESMGIYAPDGVKYVVELGENFYAFHFADGTVKTGNSSFISDSWVEVTQERAFELIGKELPRKYYYHNTQQPFPVGNYYPSRKYVVFTKGSSNTLYSFDEDGKITAIGKYQTIPSGWVEISEQRAFNVLGYKPPKSFDDSALTAAMGKPVEKKLDGSVISEFSRKFWDLAFRLETPKVEDEKSPLIYRYMRYHHEDGEVQGNGGLAFGVVINHTKKTMEVYPTICREDDTFEKSTAQLFINARKADKQCFVAEYDKDLSIIDNVSWALQWGKFTIPDNVIDKESFKKVVAKVAQIIDSNSSVW